MDVLCGAAAALESKALGPAMRPVAEVVSDYRPIDHDTTSCSTPDSSMVVGSGAASHETLAVIASLIRQYSAPPLSVDA